MRRSRPAALLSLLLLLSLLALALLPAAAAAVAAEGSLPVDVGGPLQQAAASQQQAAAASVASVSPLGAIGAFRGWLLNLHCALGMVYPTALRPHPIINPHSPPQNQTPMPLTTTQTTTGRRWTARRGSGCTRPWPRR